MNIGKLIFLTFSCLYLCRQLADHLEPFVKHVASVYNADLLHDILIQFDKNPEWDASHVAAELEIIECFENADFMKEVEISLKDDGITPLHVACKVCYLIKGYSYFLH